MLLLFTAAIVSNIEAIQQTLNVTLDAAYVHVFIPVEALIWIRSLAIVLLIVAHALRHVQIAKKTTEIESPKEQKTAKLEITPELLSALREMLTQTQTTVIEEAPETHQIAAPGEETNLLGNVLHELDRLLPSVSLDDITAVVTAYQEGVQRRNICCHLHWGSSKYSTIVKPVLDGYEERSKG